MAVASSEAARALALARWGTSRLDTMIEELAQRRAELGTQQIAALSALLDENSE